MRRRDGRKFQGDEVRIPGCGEIALPLSANSPRVAICIRKTVGIIRKLITLLIAVHLLIT